MKMINRLSFLACLTVSSILPIQGISSETRSLPVSAFSRLPEVSNIHISADGKKIIYLKNMGNYFIILRKDLETGKINRIKMDNIKSTIRFIEWANNDYVLISVFFPISHRFIPSTKIGLFVAKADGSEEARMLVRPDLRKRPKSKYYSQLWDNIISLLPDDPQHILAGIDFEKPGFPSAYKVNLNTGDKIEVQHWKKNVGRWIADQQDRIKIGRTFYEETGCTSTLIYNPAENIWSEVWKAKPVSEPYIIPMGFGKDPDILYVRADHNGRNAIFKVDVSKTDLPMELIAMDEKYDINGSLIYSPKTREVIGVRHKEADGGKIYWDETFKKYQAAVDKALPDTFNYLIDHSRDEKHYIVFATSDTKPGAYYLGNRDRDTLEILAYTHPQLEGKLRGSKKVQYTARDGKIIEAYLTLPINYTPGTPGPAVIFPHGGPMSRDYGAFDYWAEFFASKGIIVLQPNFRGSSGYGWEFRQEATQNFGLAMQDDLTDAAKWLIERKLADTEALAIVGGSYGGYAALMGAVKTPDLFKCAISFAGISDLLEFRNSQVTQPVYRIVFEWLGTNNRQLKAVSPIRFVDKIKIPILLAHGDEDRVVSVEQSRKMSKVLRKKNKVHTYIELENGDHNLSLQRNRHKFFSTMDEFLDKYLLYK